MRHPAEGTLRRLADEPSAIADPDRAHVASCPECQENLSTVREEAALAGAALHVEAAPDVDAGWRRLSGAFAAPMTAAEAVRVSRRRRPRWRAPLVAVAVAIALLTGATAAVATGWLRVFHTERIAPVTISQADLLALPDLSAYGDVSLVAAPHVREVADAAAAREATGLTVPEVAELPRGVSGDPVYQAGDRATAMFTFDGAKAGGPPELDGARFRLTVGPGVAAVWAEDRGVPALIVGRAVAPAAYSDSGVGFATARDHLLSLSGLPADVAAQLRAFTGDGTTLPLHVTDEKLTSAPADVNGAPATVLASRDGVLAAVIWVRDGVVTAVAGSLSTDEVLTVARGLR
ncbi:hypothetical protein [Catenuloplanes indicus]|uniref:DUF4367 domain-containing protein n=1 Tax=Catenuloplanes indicus TaxID=137267 RepID=A0AAE3VWY7_9ACTN|nr:hypothetical protein [Catenuloplanes indicus]MDQ0365331.1 hypothetical protein [Catenuloplanes indicus]